MRPILPAFALLLSGFCLPAAADAPPPPMLAPPAEEPPLAVPDPHAVEPDITIIHRERDMIEEYRIDGRLYMVKITPQRGAPYYLIDTTGDGQLDTRRSELEPRLLIPHWVLFRW